jgi:tetratricopeptide (TPR) repeat protein
MGEYENSDAAFQHAHRIQEDLVDQFPMVPEYRSRLSGSLNSRGNVLKYVGKRPEAEAAYREALEIQEELVAEYAMVPEYGIDLGGTYCNFGIHLSESGQPEASLVWFQKAIDRLEAVLLKEPRLYDAREFLRNTHFERANALDALGRRAKAIESREKVLELNRGLYGPSDHSTIRSMNALIDNYGNIGQFDDVLRLLKGILALRQQTLGPDDPETLGAMANVAVGYFNLGRHDEARKQREDVLALMKAKIPEHPYTFITMSNLASSYDILGRHKDALVLREETLALRKAKLGLDHADTLLSMQELAESLIQCDRGAEAVTLIDDCVRLAEDKEAVDPNLVPAVIDLRIRHFQNHEDALGCRATAEMWEQLNRTDASSLYAASCYRSVTAAVLRATDMSDTAASNVAAEVDLAMSWLHKAVAAGFNNVAHMEKDHDLDILRERDDFQKLVAGLETKATD